MTNPQNRYELLGTLGAGATSRVDKARDTLIGRTVALKTFLQGFGSRDLLQQFHREAQIIGRLAHPCIVSLYDVGTNSDGLPYFVMEYVEGKTLEDLLAAGPLPMARAAVWAADLAEALSRAHKTRIIHGDVKPANILVTPEGRVKLGDFGVARFATQISGTGSVLGTPAYLSPEQINGHLQDARSDLFSLGIVLYHMLTGVRPFQGTSVGAVCAQILSSEPPAPSHHNPSIAPALDRVVMRCLAKDPGQRYATAESLAASLYPFARNVPPPKTSKLAWWKRPFRPSDFLYLAGSTALLFAAVMGTSSWRAHSVDSGRVMAATAANRGLRDPRSSENALGEPHATTVSASPMSIMSLPVAVAADGAKTSGESSSAMQAEAPKIAHQPTKAFAARASRPKPVIQPALVADTPAVPEVAHVAPPASLASAASRTTMQVNITSAVANEILAVYAGPDLLLSTPLDDAHLQETLHFQCPISAGPHALRVALYHADQSLHTQKEGLAELAGGGSSVLEIHVNRRTKLLIKHDTALEVQWPGMLAPNLTTSQVVANGSAKDRNP